MSGGTRSASMMMENPAEIDTDNMIKTTMEYLSEE
jgi:hypothetical protein